MKQTHLKIILDHYYIYDLFCWVSLSQEQPHFIGCSKKLVSVLSSGLFY